MAGDVEVRQVDASAVAVLQIDLPAALDTGNAGQDAQAGDGGRIYLPNLNIASNTTVGRKNKQVDLWDRCV